ncbi:MAG: hypothetical protein QM758_26965 [Armatimonas sp.]
MRRAGLSALLPIACLLLVALLIRAWNIRHDQAMVPTPAAPVASTGKNRDTLALRRELKEVILRYRTLRGAEQQKATYTPAWTRWETTLDGEVVGRRLTHLRAWPDFTVQAVEQRDSGFVTVLINCDNEYLRAWLTPSPDGWKVAGLVKPFN